MADLVAIGYDDEITAGAAAAEMARLAGVLVVEPSSVAAIVRAKDGSYKFTANHPVDAGASYGVFWGSLFGMLFFDRSFQEQLRDMVRPGTSALFVVVEKAAPDKIIEALSKFGGTVLKSALSKHADGAPHGIALA